MGLAVLCANDGASAQEAGLASLPRHRVTLSGTVVGGAAGGARITVHHSRGLSGSVDPVAASVADERGAFVLRDCPWFVGREWRHNWVIVVAQKGDRVGLAQIREDQPAPTTTIQLRATRILRGNVLDEANGQPIAEAPVWPMIFGNVDHSPLTWPTEPLLPWHTTTAADGTFELRGLPVFEQYQVDVRGPQCARRLIRVDGASDNITMRLAPAGSIRGRVFHLDGTPVAGVVVWASDRGDGFARTRTDAQGRFAFESLAPRLHTVTTVSVDGPRLIATHVAVAAASSAEEIENVELRHSATGFLLGRLLDDATGEVIAGDPTTNVDAIGPTQDRRRTESSAGVSSEGRFRLEAAPGRNTIRLDLPGWEPCNPHVNVIAGRETPFDLRLRRTTTVQRR